MSATEALAFAREFGAPGGEPSAQLAASTTTRQGHLSDPDDQESDIIPLFDRRLSWILGWARQSGETFEGKPVIYTSLIIVDARTGEVAGGYTG